MTRIEYEKRTVEKMIRLYCRRNEGNGDLCADCREILDYSMARLDHCKFGDGKPSCQKCTVHCYKPEMREKIRRVMRWSGPRMMIFHPIDAIIHIWQKL